MESRDALRESLESWIADDSPNVVRPPFPLYLDDARVVADALAVSEPEREPEAVAAALIRKASDVLAGGRASQLCPELERLSDDLAAPAPREGRERLNHDDLLVVMEQLTALARNASSASPAVVEGIARDARYVIRVLAAAPREQEPPAPGEMRETILPNLDGTACLYPCPRCGVNRNSVAGVLCPSCATASEDGPSVADMRGILKPPAPTGEAARLADARIKDAIANAAWATGVIDRRTAQQVAEHALDAIHNGR